VIATRASVGLARLATIAGLVASAAGCGPEGPCRADALRPIASPRLAVVLSDYASSEIAVIEEDGTQAAPWIDSGLRPPQLVAALSGDVVLPRRIVEAGALVLVDRYQTDVLTRVAFDAPLEGLWQADLRGVRDAGTSPNPQDVLALPDGRWLVSRHNPAEDPGAPELARGNDVAVLAPATRAIVARFELGADLEVEGVRYFARPAELAPLVEGARVRVLVGLARLSSLALRLTGPGAVALLDPEDGSTDVLELEGLSNCTSVAAFPDEPARAHVLCRGDAFGEDETRAGLAVVELRDGALSLASIRRVADDPSLPPPGNGLVALEGGRFVYVSPGSLLTPRNDRLIVVEPDGRAGVLHESSPQPFELGDGAFDAARAELIVPDGNLRALLRFSFAGTSERALAPIELDPCLRLPPRQVVLVR
jgi:hypothetical protein